MKETFVPETPAWVSLWCIATSTALTSESVDVTTKTGKVSREIVSLAHHWTDGQVHYYLLAKTATAIERANAVAEVAAESTEECERCKRGDSVPHNSCIYGGRKAGHSRAHCTADACY